MNDNAELHPARLWDQGLERLSGDGLRCLLWFYAGALPWCMGLLWSWNRFANWHATWAACLQTAAVLALLYAWKRACDSRFLESLVVADGATNEPDAGAHRRLRAAHTAAAAPLFLLAWLMALPFVLVTPCVYVAGLYFSLELRREPRWRRALAAAFRRSAGWYWQQLGFALHALLLAAVVGANLLIAAFLAPRLLHALLGVATLWERVPAPVLASTSSFWVALVLATYLLTAPVVYAAAACSFELLENRTTGGDLRAALARLREGAA